MKILQITQRFYPSTGGSQWAVYQLSKELAALGHEVTVVTTTSMHNKDVRGFSMGRFFSLRSRMKKIAHEEEIDGFKVKRFTPLFQFWSYMITPWMFFWLLWNVRKYDVIQAHCYMFAEPDMAAIVSTISRKPFFLTAHDIITPFKGVYSLIKRLYDWTIGKLTLSLCTRVISDTPENTRQYRDLRVPASKIKLIPLAVDIDPYLSFRPDPAFKKQHKLKKNVVLFVARLVPYKGAQYVVEAAPAILEKSPNTSFVFIGEDQGYLKTLKELAKDLGVDEDCHFMGKAPKNDLLNSYAAANVFVLPSVGEGFGIVALEAKIMGTPTILASSGGLKYILDTSGGDSLDMTKDASSQITKYVLHHLMDPDEALLEGQRQKESVLNKFTWKRTAQQYEAIYQKFCR